MKKLLISILIFCLMATVLCSAVFAAEAPAEGTVIRVSAQKSDGTSVVVVSDHSDFVDGWNTAMGLASNSNSMNENGYRHIIVDIYADWNAVNGKFAADGKGFDNDTIKIPENVNVIVNMNGHTINRGLTTWKYDGEVIYIGKNANVVMNNGTIKGGYSCNGGGGLHIKNDADVVLNDVHITDNVVEDDCGAGIAMCSGSTLTMNGGSIKNNFIDSVFLSFDETRSAAIELSNATAVLNGVDISNNQGYSSHYANSLIYAYRSSVTMNKCSVRWNGLKDEKEDVYAARTLIGAFNSELTFIDTTFADNGVIDGYDDSALLSVFSSTVSMDNCKFEHNETFVLLDNFDDSDVNIANCQFVNNDSTVYCGGRGNKPIFFEKCTFSNNHGWDDEAIFNNIKATITFTDCDLGETTFESREKVVIANSTDNVPGSIFGEGSMTMIISLTALAVSVASLGVTVISGKKKPASATTENNE